MHGREIREMMYKDMVRGGKEEFKLRYLARDYFGREPSEKEERRLYMHLRRMENRGFVRVEQGENKGGINKYYLTDVGRKVTKIEMKGYICTSCNEQKDDEEVVKLPTCKECGSKVHRITS